MDKKNNAYYLGIDLCDTYAMVSFYQLNMEEPDTVSTIAGSENYRIPLILARRKNVGMWYYGDEARKMAKTSEVLCVDCLLQRAINKEKVLVGDTSYDAVELLALFLKKVMELPQKLGTSMHQQFQQFLCVTVILSQYCFFYFPQHSSIRNHLSLSYIKMVLLFYHFLFALQLEISVHCLMLFFR